MTSDRRYAPRRSDDGTWVVVDVEKDIPVVIHDKQVVRLREDAAKDAVELLNMVDLLRREKPDAPPEEFMGSVKNYLLPVGWKA